jgi:tetratricopeptide (TPR) repeat protein
MSPTPSNDKDREIERLLQEAEALLRKDMEKEVEALKKDFNARIDLDKYERAKAKFERVLELDPKEQRALDGLSVCEEMLFPYTPVQYMVPAMNVVNVTAIDARPPPKDGADVSTVEAQPPPKDDLMPWDMIRMRRERDEEGIRYTARKIGEGAEEYKMKARAMISQAKDEVDAGKPREKAYVETMKALEELQEELRVRYKGMGPYILDELMYELMLALGMEPEA